MRAVLPLGSKGGGSTHHPAVRIKHVCRKGLKSRLSRVLQKLKEWIIAVKLERNFTKQEIIALYLNTVPYSDNVYGIRNACPHIFF